MKRILMSLLTVGVVAIVAIFGTSAFFSDTETSLGNTFAAGAIDLKIGNESYVTNNEGVLVESEETSWELSDLAGQLFFNFLDLKPGDIGEDTIEIQVTDNDAWVCAAARVTEDSDVSYTEPELADDETVNEADPEGTDGELAENLHFIFWADDGDNVLETNEVDKIFVNGTADQLDEVGVVALADAANNVWSGEANDPLTGAESSFIAKAWCFGTLELNPQAPGDLSPLDNTGFICNGASDATNAAQTDRVRGDIQFYAVQSRNNPDFSCAGDYDPTWPDVTPEPTPGGEVGALLSAYIPPTDCTEDETVETVEELVAAVEGAEPNDRICVADNDYDLASPLVLDVDGLTLTSLTNPNDSTTITGGIFVDAHDVTITGFVLDGYAFMGASNNAAIYIHNEAGQGTGDALTGTTISYNRFLAPGDAKTNDVKAIITEIGSGSVIANDITIMHNVFEDWNQGIFFNTANYEVHHNDFYGNTVGVANDGPHNGDIHHNDFEGNTSEAVGVAPNAVASTTNNGRVKVNFNNLAPSGDGNNVNWYGIDFLSGADVDAENNWWDGEAEAVRTNNTTEVDTEPAAGAAYPEN